MPSATEIRIARVAEVTYGTTPATPAFTVKRSQTALPFSSKKVLSDLRDVGSPALVDALELGQDVEGSMDIKLSYGAYDDEMESALGGAWTANVLKDGRLVKSATYEQTIELGATDSFHRFSGVVATSMSLSLKARSEITGSFSFAGKVETLGEAIISGATYTTPTAETVMRAGHSVGALTINTLTTPCVQELSLEFSRGLDPKYCVLSESANGMTPGDTSVSGKVTVYFDNSEAYTVALNHGTAAITATIGDATGKKYTVRIPRARWVDPKMSASGQTGPIMAELAFVGIYDAAEACVVKITRAVV